MVTATTDGTIQTIDWNNDPLPDILDLPVSEKPDNRLDSELHNGSIDLDDDNDNNETLFEFSDAAGDSSDEHVPPTVLPTWAEMSKSDSFEPVIEKRGASAPKNINVIVKD
jgi:hypothetical protein